MIHLHWAAEWELYEKVNFDGVNKIISVYPHVTSLDIREDVWSASVRWLGMKNRGNDRFLESMERTGLDAIPGGQTGDFYFLTNGWKLEINFAKVKVTGVLFSRDYETAYYTYEGIPQYAVQVSSVVNVVNSPTNVVTGDIATVPTVAEITAAVWANISRTLTEQQATITAQDKLDIANAVYEVPVPTTPAVGSWGEFLKDKLLTTFRFKALK